MCRDGNNPHSYRLFAAPPHFSLCSIIFRDLKPCNLGFDVRGNIRLFDFGVAKELKKRDHVDDGLYACTPLTGTRVRCEWSDMLSSYF